MLVLILFLSSLIVLGLAVFRVSGRVVDLAALGIFLFVLAYVLHVGVL